MKVPEGLARFVPVGDGPGTRLVPLEEVIAHFSDRLFPGIEIVEQSLFRVTRDADFELSDEADDLLEAVESELRRRRFGDAVRLEVSDGMSAAMRERLCSGLGVTDAQVYDTPGLMDMADLREIADLDRPELKHEPWIPVTRARLADPEASGDLFARIRADDLLVHLPYESFVTSVEAFVRAAAKDAGVVGVKTTVYRTSDDTALLPALIEAAERAKQAVCLVELKARFDERRNIEWSRAMEQAGVHVVHGFRDLKIHAKTTLVIRREGGVLRRYAHIGTGNYNGVTARLYEDLGLFTDDEAITADVADLFNHMTGFGRPQQFRKLLVAPFNLRTRLIDHIRSVADAAGLGPDGDGQDEGQLAHRSRDHRGALPRVAGRRPDRHRGPLDLLAPARRPRAVGADPRALDRRPLPRAQPPLRVRGRRPGHLPARERRHHAAQPRPPDRGADARSRTPASSTRSRRSSTRCSATARRPGCSRPTGRGRAFAPNGAARSAGATRSSCGVRACGRGRAAAARRAPSSRWRAVQLTVAADPEEAAVRAATALAAAARTGGSISLAGSNTPRRTYELLAAEPGDRLVAGAPVVRRRALRPARRSRLELPHGARDADLADRHPGAERPPHPRGGRPRGRRRRVCGRDRRRGARSRAARAGPGRPHRVALSREPRPRRARPGGRRRDGLEAASAPDHAHPARVRARSRRF